MACSSAVTSYSCDHPCDRPLSCNRHVCTKRCHAPLDGSKWTSTSVPSSLNTTASQSEPTPILTIESQSSTLWKDITSAKSLSTKASEIATTSTVSSSTFSSSRSLALSDSQCGPCGKPCANARPEGCSHKCGRVCHVGNCAKCTQLCPKKCYCGGITLQIECYVLASLSSESLANKPNFLSCGVQCCKTLSCGHLCTKKCHKLDECSLASDCVKEVLLKCPCGRMRKVCYVILSF